MELIELTPQENLKVTGGIDYVAIGGYFGAMLTPWIVAFLRIGGNRAIQTQHEDYQSLSLATKTKIAADALVRDNGWKDMLIISGLFLTGNILFNLLADQISGEDGS